jgi:ketosteroid isomerase-like protein
MCPINMEKAEEALRLAAAFLEAFNAHDKEALAELFSDNCVFESAGPAPLGLRHEGKVAVSEAIGGFFSASPQIVMEAEEIYGLCKRAVLRWVIKGAVGFPLGKRGVDLFTSRDGRIVELYAYAKG